MLRVIFLQVERERDKERLESRRKLELLKRANDEELDEGRRKVSELQCDLLELRDAHAKLRTANEKLRRERERYEKERDPTSRRRYMFILIFSDLNSLFIVFIYQDGTRWREKSWCIVANC